MDQKNFTIGILSTTAVVLFAALAVIFSQSNTASASGLTTNAGGYILTVGSVAVNDEELLYVTQLSSKRIGIYRFDNTTRKIELADGIELNALAPAGAKGQPAGGKKP